MLFPQFFSSLCGNCALKSKLGTKNIPKTKEIAIGKTTKAQIITQNTYTGSIKPKAVRLLQIVIAPPA